MRSMRSLSIFLTLLVFCGVLAFAEIIKSGSFQASSDGVNVTLRWLTEDEKDVAHFEIERRSGASGQFALLSAVDVKGASLYEFIDHSAFEKIASLYQYRIKIVYSNGAAPTYSTVLTVSH